MRFFVFLGVSFTVLLGIGLSIEHFLDKEHYNPRFYDFPLTIGLHVALGSSYLGLALLQFSSSIRTRHPAIHRNVGRITVALGIVSGVSALMAIILFPFSGPAMLFFVAPFACYFAFALIRGFQLARLRDFDKHREWMIRALAIASAIATQRLILVPALIAFGTEPVTIRWVSVVSFTVAFLVHASIAEVWIRQTRHPAVEAFH